jgi:serine/threonine protein kinase
MEDRYQIRGKIGQGGIGAVYRAFDSRMNREVAIKRILPEATDDLQEEATSQLLREAGSLASLQHPHIVTVYDVGTDDDGPYVVMELITGKTLDELVSRAPLTWADFRELAMQTQEALIAAQDHDIVHRDIKPGNVMLSWLPSGKFQVKIVDFGLAKFTPKPSLQTLDQNESVFGSIFFMAPEQFERGPLDARTDLYAMGCVYYHSLTGKYPFDGESGPQVMASHLHHQVVPLQVARPDLPRWVCDWVMWHINRYPAERPETARQALQIFLQNDTNPNPVPAPATEPVMSTGTPSPAPEQPKRPRLIIPGAAAPPPPAAPPAPIEPIQIVPVPVAVTPEPVPVVPDPPLTQTAPQPLMPPEGSKPSIHTAPQPLPVVQPEPVAETPAAAPPPAPAPVPVAVPVAPTAPRLVVPAAAVPTQPVIPAAVPTAPPPVAVQPTAQPAPAAIPMARPAASGRLAVGGIPAASPAQAPGVVPTPGALYGARPAAPGTTLPKPQKAGMSASAKGAIAAILAIVVVIFAVVLINRSSRNRETNRYNELIALAAKEGATEVPVNSNDLDIFLNAASDVGANEQRQTIYTALFLAKATDGTDIDARIAEFATKQPMQPDVREVIIRDVLRKRANPKVVPTLLAYARTTSDTKAAIAALQACRFMATDDQFGEFLDVIKFTPEAAIRQAAEENAAEIIKKSTNREELGNRLAAAYEAAVNDDLRHSLIRLLGRTSGEKAEEIVKKALAAPDKKDQLAAILSLGTWSDDTMFETLMEHLEEQEDEQMRARAFDSGFRFLTDADRKMEEDISEDFWKMLARNAKIRSEQEKVIRGLANNETADWAISVIEYFVDEADDDEVIDLAEKALDRMRERAKIREGREEDKDDEEEDEEKEDEEE